MLIDTFVLVLSGVIIAVLLLVLFRFRRDAGDPGSSRRRTEPGTSHESRTKPCPLCSTMLKPAWRVHSVVYPGKPDKLMHIFGCPVCRNGEKKRMCPVCGQEVPKDGYVIARVFEKPGRTHVHVLGCTRCRMG